MKGEHCPCIAISHSHAAGQCDEPMPPSGPTVCPTCRAASGTFTVGGPDELAEAIRSKGLTSEQRAAVYALIEGKP